MKKKLLIATTVPETLASILKDQPRFLNNFFQVSLVTSPGQDLDSLTNEGVPIHTVSMERGISPIKDLVSIVQMVQLMLVIRPDIVHSYTPKAGFVCMVSAWISRVPYRVHTFTGLIWPTTTGWKRLLLVMVDRLLCFCATHIVPEGAGVKLDLEVGRITSKNMKVIGNGNVAGIDMDFFSAKAEGISDVAEDLKRKYLINSNHFTFVYVGRLNRDKGLYELITAFEQAPMHCRLLIVGKLDESAPLNPALLKRLEGHPRVYCLGFQQDVRPAIMLADVLVLPSYREGFPNVLLQAGAMETPVIATDINGCNEVIRPKFNGWLVPAKNSAELLRAMKTACLTTDKMLIEMGRTARAHIMKLFERNLYWDNLMTFYIDLYRLK